MNARRSVASGACMAIVVSLTGGAAHQSVPAADAIVTGQVRLIDAAGPGVPSVRVSAIAQNGAEAAHATSDGDGRFELRVAPGRYAIEARRTGFLPAAFGSHRQGLPGSPLRLAAGQRVQVEIVIQRAAGISGVVRDERGNPVSNTTVEARRWTDDEPDVAGAVLLTARTEPDGAYRLLGLAPGDYRVVALPGHHPVASLESADRFNGPAAQFFPLAGAASQAQPVTLAANDERRGIDFSLPRRPLTRVTGRFVVPDGISLHDQPMVIVTGIEDTPPVVFLPMGPSRGEFVVSLHPGRYRADVRVSGSASEGAAAGQARAYAASAIFDVPDAVAAGFDLLLRPGVTVSVRLHQGGGVRPEIGVRLVPRPLRPAVVRPVDLQPAADGTFRADVVAPGRYVVELGDHDGDWFLDEVRAGGTRRPDAVVLVGEDDDIELVVSRRTASLSGQLLGAGTAASDYVLVLLPEDTAGQPPRGSPPVLLARADNTGWYTFTRCRAGRHVLLVLSDVDPADIGNPEVVEHLRRHPAAVRVSLKADGETTQDLQVAPRADVTLSAWCRPCHGPA